ncbi:ADP-ribosyltransferase [Sodalis sp. dw_96]|uniref:ADP-ribosyltransferase n=1 Tax=Sodalis sp. dw_96 TaxID=2719794 RepID=UPI001BD6B837|nr:ADP-ribosyltransferase [Sodalis sp. dw_96]
MKEALGRFLYEDLSDIADHIKGPYDHLLTEDDKIAIYYYSTDRSLTINNALRTNQWEDESHLKIVQQLERALSKLPVDESKLLIRWQNFDHLPQPPQVGDIIFCPGFVSTSCNLDFEFYKKKNYKLLILHNDGRYISPYSSIPSEAEVLINRNNFFEIKKICDRTLLMKQLDIAELTIYCMKDLNHINSKNTDLVGEFYDKT